MTVSRGGVTISEQDMSDADARISGSEQDWIEALGPAADRGALTVSGDERLATAVLDGVGASAAAAMRAA
jgi:hypothetical protein